MTNAITIHNSTALSPNVCLSTINNTNSISINNNHDKIWTPQTALLHVVIDALWHPNLTEVDSSWNVTAYGDTREGKWRGNWRMEWVASTLHTTSEHCVSSITIPDHQFGFRRKHTTIEQVHRITNIINRALENKQYSTAAFLNISQTFDKVLAWRTAV